MPHPLCPSHNAAPGDDSSYSIFLIHPKRNGKRLHPERMKEEEEQCQLPGWPATNNKSRAEEHLLPPSKEEDKGERSRRDPAFDLLILPYSFNMEPKLMNPTSYLPPTLPSDTSPSTPAGQPPSFPRRLTFGTASLTQSRCQIFLMSPQVFVEDRQRAPVVRECHTNSREAHTSTVQPVPTHSLDLDQPRHCYECHLLPHLLLLLPHLYRSNSYPSNATTSGASTTASGISQVILWHYNHTGRLQNRTISNTQSPISITVAFFLSFSIFIILENFLVLVAVISRIRHSRRAAYLVNICMSGSQTFRLTPALWLFREGMLFVALAASIFSLLLIAVERYTTMMKPMPQKSTKTTYYRIYGLVALCWAFALVIGFLPLLGWNCVCSLDGCSTLLPLYSKTYILFSLFIFFLILLAIGVLYGAIYCHVHKSAQLGPHRSRKRSLALLKTVITIVGVFLLCWGPLFLLLLVDFFCASRHCALLFSADYFISLAVLNSGLNPIIYALGSSEMRKAIAELLCCCCLKAGLCNPDKFTSKDTSSTSESRRDSLRNSFSKIRNLSVASPPSTPSKSRRAPKKYRLSSTTSCLSVSSVQQTANDVLSEQRGRQRGQWLEANIPCGSVLGVVN
ncbi:hypothetical protein INR49_019554 [Caranx melampygus]|nr:hypothetical protein INR49_019554 [Caranx melampygus]